MKRRLALFFILVFLSGCAHFPGGIAPSSTPIDGRPYHVIGEAHGTDGHWALLGIIPLSGGNTVREAVDDAIASQGGDALIDVTLNFRREWWILFIRNVTEAEGKAIKFTD